MHINPVSFKSLMVFSINDNKPKMSVPAFLKTSFNNNKALKHYKLTEEKYESKIDGTVNNAAKDFCNQLDLEYDRRLPKGSNEVIFTTADFYDSPDTTQERYFITGATDKDEKKIFSILSGTRDYFVAKFNNYKAN